MKTSVWGEDEEELLWANKKKDFRDWYSQNNYFNHFKTLFSLIYGKRKKRRKIIKEQKKIK